MSDKLFDLLLDDSFVRFSKGEASEVESAAWTSWMHEDPKHPELVNKARALLEDGFQRMPAPDKDEELTRLLERIEPRNEQKNRYVHRPGHPRMSIIWATLATAAGILIVVGFLGWDYFFPENRPGSENPAQITYRTITTEYGERKTFRYSDGSNIILNAGSELRLPQNVAGTNSFEVWLKGEALFNINRKSAPEARSFIVHTPDSDITVLGTLFAVNTNDGQTRVVLETGRLSFNVRDSLNNRNLKYEMVPGELALFSSQFHEIRVQKVNPEVYLSWAGDSLILDQTPFSDLIDRIENTYGLRVVVEDQTLLNEKLTGHFGNLELKVLLEGLEKTLDVNIQKSDSTIYIKK